MRITVERAPLLEALNQACKGAALNGRRSIACTQWARLDVEPAGLEIRTCDLSSWSTLRVPGTRGGALQLGGAVVQVDAFRDLIKGLDRGALVDLSADRGAGRLLVQAGRARLSLTLQLDKAGAHAETIPEPGDVKAGARVELRRLLDLVGTVKAAASIEEQRYYLNGVLLEADSVDGAPALRVTATDGHLLLSATAVDGSGLVDVIKAGPHNLARSSGPAAAVIVPSFAIKRLEALAAGLVDGSTATVNFAKGDSVLIVDAGAFRYAFEVIDGSFPDYRRVIPGLEASSAGTWSAPADRLHAFYKAGAIGRKPAGIAARLVEGAPVIWTSQKAESGAISNRDAPGAYCGELVERAFNPAVMARGLEPFAGAVVSIALQVQAGTAALVTSTDRPDLVAVVMPLMGCEYETAPAAVDAFEPLFPGAAADLWNVTAGNQNNLGKVRSANVDEIRAYCADLVARAGLPDRAPVATELAAAAVSGLGRAIECGAVIVKASSGAPAEYEEGAFSLLIPGGRRSNSVTLERLDESGAVIEARAVPTDAKAAILLDGAAVQAATGLEPIKATRGRKAKAGAVKVDQAPPVAVQVDQAAPIEAAAAPGAIEEAPAAVQAVDGAAAIIAAPGAAFAALEALRAAALEPIEAAPDLEPIAPPAESGWVDQDNRPLSVDELPAALEHAARMQAAAAAFDAEYGQTGAVIVPIGFGRRAARQVEAAAPIEETPALCSGCGIEAWQCRAHAVCGGLVDAVDGAAINSGLEPIEAPAVDQVDQVEAAALEPIEEAPAAVDVDQVEAPAAVDLAARLERLERLLGLEAMPRRSAAHAATIRRAWRARADRRAWDACKARERVDLVEAVRIERMRAECSERGAQAAVDRANKEAADWQAIATANAGHVDQARADLARATDRIQRLEAIGFEAEKKAAAAFAEERQALEARIDKLTGALAYETARADRNRVDLSQMRKAKRRIRARAVAMRVDLARTRSARDGLAANLAALTARAAADAKALEAMRAGLPVDGAAPRRFILSSR